eukprot:TRINITY_DN2929_c0_g1_i4.p1 TRINITY_DN2929_c0_g1~~TRINITY_DN2929_c0_g1_i4.p1  ORF type:complete len:316 (+),score=82.13 TRINITY_DN2929_c0_g1_i4:23-970(+)
MDKLNMTPISAPGAYNNMQHYETTPGGNMYHPHQARGIQYHQHPVGHFPYQGEMSHVPVGHGAGTLGQASGQQIGYGQPSAASEQFQASGHEDDRLQYQHRTAGDQFYQPSGVQYFQQAGATGEPHKLRKLPATDAALVNDSGIESEYEGPGEGDYLSMSGGARVGFDGQGKGVSSHQNVLLKPAVADSKRKRMNTTVEPASVAVKRLRSTASGMMQREAIFRMASKPLRDGNDFRRQSFGENATSALIRTVYNTGSGETPVKFLQEIEAGRLQSAANLLETSLPGVKNVEELRYTASVWKEKLAMLNVYSKNKW